MSHVMGHIGGGTLPKARKSKRAGWTTYVTGILHGLQPDALFVVIPALALPTRLASVMFISMFVIGTIVSMGGYTLLIGGWTCSCFLHMQVLISRC